jgi:hypothetical protein
MSSLPADSSPLSDAAFELGDQHGARLRLQRPQKIAQPFDGLSVARHTGHHQRQESIPIPLGGRRLRGGYAG